MGNVFSKIKIKQSDAVSFYSLVYWYAYIHSKYFESQTLIQSTV
jgi:hypothetical protein